MQHLEVSCAVRRFFKSLGFKGLSTPRWVITNTALEILYMNTKYQSKHNHLLYNCYLWATCFDSLESSSWSTKNWSKVI